MTTATLLAKRCKTISRASGTFLPRSWSRSSEGRFVMVDFAGDTREGERRNCTVGYSGNQPAQEGPSYGAAITTVSIALRKLWFEWRQPQTEAARTPSAIPAG